MLALKIWSLHLASENTPPTPGNSDWGIKMPAAKSGGDETWGAVCIPRLETMEKEQEGQSHHGRRKRMCRREKESYHV